MRSHITDTNNGDHASSNYPVTMFANDLTSNVNVAIDEGLWFLHSNMNRYVNVLDEGDWSTTSCSFVCYNGIYSVTATNLQAFEVNGHLESGPAADPYTEDVARALKPLIGHLTTRAIANFVTPSGTIHPDGNGNGRGIELANAGEIIYETGMVIDALSPLGPPGQSP